jgi:hypothetical protein
MSAIANILREAADKIEAVCDADKVIAAPTPAPALPEPPEGFHPAMMGPIPHPAEPKSDDIVTIWNGGWSIGGWQGTSKGEFYALRIGSDIARLNGLGLNLELGKTYATNAGEIVDINESQGFSYIFKSSKRKGEWNSIGQALIDGVAQPLDHPDSIKEEIPAELLPLPKLPDGFKEWRWRGKGWKAKNVTYAFASSLTDKFDLQGSNSTYGHTTGYYLEAIPADKEPAKAREWEINHDGLSTYPIAISVPFDQKRIEPGMPVMAREVLPGEPSAEDVEKLVDALKHGLKRMEHLESYLAREKNAMPSVDAAIGYARKALQPFTGKESE